MKVQTPNAINHTCGERNSFEGAPSGRVVGSSASCAVLSMPRPVCARFQPGFGASASVYTTCRLAGEPRSRVVTLADRLVPERLQRASDSRSARVRASDMLAELGEKLSVDCA